MTRLADELLRQALGIPEVPVALDDTSIVATLAGKKVA